MCDTQVKCASIHTTGGMSSATITSDGDDFSHVQPAIDKLPFSLTAEQRAQAIDLIKSLMLVVRIYLRQRL